MKNVKRRFAELLRPHFSQNDFGLMMNALEEDLLPHMGHRSLSKAEDALLSEGLSGRVVEVGEAAEAANESQAPGASEIRGCLLEWLLTEPGLKSRLGRRRLYIKGASIVRAKAVGEALSRQAQSGKEALGPSLQLQRSELSAHVTFVNCEFPGGVVLRGAVCRDFELINCRVGSHRPGFGFYKGWPVSIDASFLRVQGLFSIAGTEPPERWHERYQHAIKAEGTAAKGQKTLDEKAIPGVVDLRKAHVKGTVDLRRAWLLGGAVALDAGGLVAERVLISENFRAAGTVYFYGCDIAQEFDARGAFIDAAQGKSAAQCKSAVQSESSGQHEECPAEEHSEELRTLALCLRHAKIGGRLRLSDGHCALGVTDLMHARISGPLELRGGRFFNPDGVALLANYLRVEGDVLLHQSLRQREPAYDAQPTWRRLYLARPLAPSGATANTSATSNSGASSRHTSSQEKLNGRLASTLRHVREKLPPEDVASRSINGRQSSNRPKSASGSETASVLIESVGEARKRKEKVRVEEAEEKLSKSHLLVGSSSGDHSWLWKDGYRWRCLVLGEASFVGVRIGGQFDAKAAVFIAPCRRDRGGVRGLALTLHRARISGRLMLGDGLRAEGTVAMEAASIDGSVRLRGGWFLNPGGIALLAARIKVGGDVLFASETLIGDRRTLAKRRAENDENAVLELLFGTSQRRELLDEGSERLHRQYLALFNSEEFSGESLREADYAVGIKSKNTSCDSQQKKRQAKALEDYLRSLASDPEGAVTSTAENALPCKVEDPPRAEPSMEKWVCNAARFLMHRSVCFGAMVFKRAEVKGSVDFSGGLFVSMEGPPELSAGGSSDVELSAKALDAQQMRVGRAVFLGDWSPGTPREDRRFRNRYPLIARGVVDLSSARAQQFHVMPERAASVQKALTGSPSRSSSYWWIEGFRYELIFPTRLPCHAHYLRQADGEASQENAVDLVAECDWFDHNSREATNQPYEQLAAVLRRQGHHSQARRVLLHLLNQSKQRGSDGKQKRTLLYCVFSRAEKVAFPPKWACISLFLLWLLGGVSFFLLQGCEHQGRKFIVKSKLTVPAVEEPKPLPNAASASQATAGGPKATKGDSGQVRIRAGKPILPNQDGNAEDREPDYPRYQPFVTSLEALLPFVNLGMSDYYQANHWLVYFLTFVLNLFGVLLVGAFAVGIAEVVRKPS